MLLQLSSPRAVRLGWLVALTFSFGMLIYILHANSVVNIRGYYDRYKGQPGTQTPPPPPTTEQQQPGGEQSNQANLGIQNSTLGFGRIMAVSPGPSWRSQGLLRAAKRTGMSIDIPGQYHSTEKQVEEFIKVEHLNKGSATAWIAHLDAIKYAYMSNWTSMIILEDDVDWDVDIRNQLTPIADSIRQLTNPTADVNEWPFGEDWDVLWLGHCGEKYATPEANRPGDTPKDFPPYLTFQDPTIPDAIRSYHGNIKHTNQTRFVQFAQGPICSFAYAITHESAKKMLDMKQGAEQAFDIWMLVRCMNRELRCLSVVPELFRHHRAAGYSKSLINTGNVEKTNHTANILHSARCNSDRYDHNDLITCMDKVD